MATMATIAQTAEQFSAELHNAATTVRAHASTQIAGLSLELSSFMPAALDRLGLFVTEAPTTHPKFAVTQLASDSVPSLEAVRKTLSAIKPVEVFKGEYAQSAPMGTLGTVHAFTGESGDWEVVRFGCAIFVLTPRTHGHADRLLLRIVRELVLRTHHRSGGIGMHAAVVELGGRGLLIVGASGAGKTTLALRMAQAGAALVGNDFALLRGTSCGALPLSYRVGLGTVDAMPRLREISAASGDPCVGITRKAAGEMADAHTFGSPSKFEIEPVLLAAAMGARLASHTNIEAVLIPRLEPDGGPVTLRSLGRNQALKVLRREARSPAAAPWLRSWLIDEPSPSAIRRSLDSNLEQLVNAAPSLMVTGQFGASVVDAITAHLGVRADR